MQPMSFIEAFMQVFIACASLLTIFLIISILSIMRRVDRGLLKARLFLNDAVMQQTWVYFSIAGASFALNTLITLIVRFATTGEKFNTYYMVEITQFIFLAAFILAILKWYEFIGSFDKYKQFKASAD